MKRIILLILFNMILSAQQISWKSLEGPMGGFVGDIAINSKGEIFAGAYSAVIPFSGLYKSTDNGTSWNKILTQFNDFEIYSVYIAKNDVIWIGTNYQDRIYRSTDNGVSWEIKRTGFNSGQCWALMQNKDGVLFAGDAQFNKIYRSTDNGENWAFSASISAYTFAVDSNNIVYAGAKQGLLKSTDNGTSWILDSSFADIPVSTILIDSGKNIFCGTGYNNNGKGIFYSNDQGKNWTNIGLSDKIVLSLAMDSNGNLFAGTRTGGLYKTADLGKTWTHFDKGLYRKELFRMKLNKQNDIFIGSENEGIFRSTNNGDNFEQVGLPISIVHNIAFSGDNYIYAATQSGVQKYDRINKTWTNKGLQNVEAVSLSSNNILYAGTTDDGLYKSTDFGETWILTDVTKNLIFAVNNIAAIDDTVFAVTDQYLKKSTDNGQTWTTLPLTTPDYGICFNKEKKSLLVVGSKNSANILYASDDYGAAFDSLFTGFGIITQDGIEYNGNYIMLAALEGLFMSSDNGSTWESKLNKKMSSTFLNNQGLLLAGAQDSMYYSDNYGLTFKSIPYPFNDKTYVNGIYADGNNKLFMGTYSKGLYETNVVTEISENFNTVKTFSLAQNYPNPFNPNTRISYTLPEENYITLRVYNALGELVKTLASEFQKSGEHHYDFSGLNLSSGVYFYKLQAGDFTSVKKMILLK